MLNVVNPRLMACVLAFAVCVGAPQVIRADETGDFTAAVMPATNRISDSSALVQELSLSSALAEIHGVSEKSQPSDRAAPQKRRSTWPTPARFFTINQVVAKRENGASALEFASIRPTETPDDHASQIPPTQGEEPFGLFTFKAPDGLVSVKWHKLQSDIKAAAPALEHCRTEQADCTAAAARFAAIIKDAAALPLRAKLRLVNERVNAAIRYTEDWAQWHQADVWSAPLDTAHKGSFDTGMGDCEDYAIAKYAALREAGVPERDLRVLLVKDQAVRLDHAVLAVREDGHWVILDNRWSRLAEDNELRQFVPLFALNEDGAKLFAAPYANRSPVPEIEALSQAKGSYMDTGLSLSLRTGFGATDTLPLLM
jgi:predicted transglutaminase-like cysteine proteinase